MFHCPALLSLEPNPTIGKPSNESLHAAEVASEVFVLSQVHQHTLLQQGKVSVPIIFKHPDIRCCELSER